MTDWQKLDNSEPTFLGGELGLKLSDESGNKLALSFTPAELADWLSGMLANCGLLPLAPGVPWQRPENARRVRVSGFRVVPGAQPDMAVFVALCGPVPIAFEVPLADLIAALDGGMH